MLIMNLRFLLASSLLILSVCYGYNLVDIPAEGAEPQNTQAPEENKMASNFNLPLKTGGGTQVWTDHIWRDGYRIQQNALTGHWRLLDQTDVRRAWGERDEVDAMLETLSPKAECKSGKKPTVILLHGLMRTHHSFKKLDESLRGVGYDRVIRFSYASTRFSIGSHAAALRELIEDLPADTELCFVGHSLGNIVVRHLIGDLQRDGDPHHVISRCRSMVMLGPPNQGAAIARRLAPTGLFGVVVGTSGIELGERWKEVRDHLATPPFPFAIVAGDVSDNPLKNPLVDGSSDFVVSLEEAKLDGCEKLTTIPVLHSFLMSDDDACEFSREFIQSH